MASDSNPTPQPKPGSINALLAQRSARPPLAPTGPHTLAAPHAPAAPVLRAPPVGSEIQVELDKLDQNPFQHRTHMDEGKLAELMAGIAQKGLIEPVVVRPVGERYQLIAGHRRTEAYRRLREKAEGQERERWMRIRATQLQVSDEDMALIALQENLQREDPSAVDLGEGIALVQEKFKLSTEQVAQALGLELRRVQRLLQLQAAPAVIKAAVGKGLMVEVEPEGEGKEVRREHRKVEFLAALETLKLYKHLTRKKELDPRRAEERLEAFLQRAARHNWGFRKVAAEVEKAIKGREEEGSEARAEAPLFKRTGSSLLVHFDRLEGAKAQELAELRKHLKALLERMG